MKYFPVLHVENVLCIIIFYQSVLEVPCFSFILIQVRCSIQHHRLKHQIDLFGLMQRTSTYKYPETAFQSKRHDCDSVH